MLVSQRVYLALALHKTAIGFTEKLHPRDEYRIQWGFHVLELVVDLPL
jgi:hypothetical protein